MDLSPNVTDERFNTASHMAGAIFALLGTVLLIVYSSVAAKPWHIVSFSIYGFSLVALFLASTLHHGVKASARIKDILRAIDYFAIYLLIAGTITPVCLVVLRGPLGWSVFGVAWAVGFAGIVLKAVIRDLPKWISMTLYITMGWLGVVVGYPLFKALSWPGVGLMIAGGLFYTVGAFIFYIEKPNPLPGRFGFHEIWHIFVLLGALFHYVFMYVCVLPLPN
ncbi:MAG: hemolysin III family protein [Deltaproteobacteria bacterium]|nr:hemolysin III family protein [Deltaproteobacteria bacterium]